MYLLEKIEGHQGAVDCNMRWRCGLTDEQLKDAETVEVHASSFNDPGDDFNEYRFFRADGSKIATVRKEGF